MVFLRMLIKGDLDKGNLDRPQEVVDGLIVDERFRGFVQGTKQRTEKYNWAHSEATFRHNGSELSILVYWGTVPDSSNYEAVINARDIDPKLIDDLRNYLNSKDLTAEVKPFF